MVYPTHLGRPLWGLMSTYGMSASVTSGCGTDGDPERAALEPEHLVQDSEGNQQGAQQSAQRKGVVRKSHNSLHWSK